MKISELYENFSPNKVYIHGGPSKLEGDHFKRGGRKGHDMGALFFIEESDAGYKYALGYASGTDTGIYRVNIKINPNDIFDFTRSDHKKFAKEFLNPQEYESWEQSKGDSGHIDWAVIDEELIEDMGFKGVMIHERNAGQISKDSIVSVAVFDPKYTKIIGFIPKKDAIEKIL
jgi:hypothetical protein